MLKRSLKNATVIPEVISVSELASEDLPFEARVETVSDASLSENSLEEEFAYIFL